MRVCTLFGFLLLARSAAAETTKQCYAGTVTLDKPHAIVMMRELRPDAHEIRLHSWSDMAPGDSTATMTIAADGKSYTVAYKIGSGTGTLEGEPWRWTTMHEKANVLGMELVSEGDFSGDTLHITVTVGAHGKAAQAIHGVYEVFDCAELDQRRKKLNARAR
jgi:hypothetical protein